MIPLARQLEAGLVRKNLTVEELSARTKVPSFSIHTFLGAPVVDELPERVYLRGHLGLLVRELDLDHAAVMDAFDAAFPRDPEPEVEYGPPPAFGRRELALAAGLGGVALLAVVLAVASALD